MNASQLYVLLLYIFFSSFSFCLMRKEGETPGCERQDGAKLLVLTVGAMTDRHWREGGRLNRVLYVRTVALLFGLG